MTKTILQASPRTSSKEVCNAQGSITLAEAQIRAIDQELLKLHAKLKAEQHVQIRHRLVTQIDKLLDERNQLTQ